MSHFGEIVAERGLPVDRLLTHAHRHGEYPDKEFGAILNLSNASFVTIAAGSGILSFPAEAAIRKYVVAGDAGIAIVSRINSEGHRSLQRSHFGKFLEPQRRRSTKNHSS
jgi:hypothetical protein